MFVEFGAKVVEVVGVAVEKVAEVSQSSVEGAQILSESPLEEIGKGSVEVNEGEGKILEPKIELIKTTSLESIVEVGRAHV